MIKKQDIVEFITKEFATTLRVMEAYPADQILFTPHERSSTAKKLLSTFVFEMYLLDGYVVGTPFETDKFKTYDPQDIATIISDFKTETAKIVTEIEAMREENLAKTISFAGRTFMADEFIMMMLHDQIHHRGQLTVYVRMAGGMVPSIYGPSADDTATNL
jgi:hypothetical protein